MRLVARAGAEVLVTGPAGSGTAKVAEVIHLVSPAAPHPFVKRSAAALSPESLTEACEEAGAGTLFLDEVAALGPAAQLALLDRLDSGGEARVIAGTYKHLSEEVASGRFSADLAMRLDVLHVHIPPLDERKEDIPALFKPLCRTGLRTGGSAGAGDHARCGGAADGAGLAGQCALADERGDALLHGARARPRRKRAAGWPSNWRRSSARF